MTNEEIEKEFEEWHDKQTDCCNHCKNNCIHKPWEKVSYLAGHQKGQEEANNKVKGTQALADEKCKWFLDRAEKAEERANRAESGLANKCMNKNSTKFLRK